MIELLDPRKIERVAPELWQNAGWSYALDYSWIILHCDEYMPSKGGALVIDAGCGVAPFSPLGAYIGRMLGAQVIGVDRNMGRDFMTYVPPEPPEIIFWASSLEHNTVEDMKKLYLRSMELLAPGGIFLATITVGFASSWFEPSANMILTPEAAAMVFDETEMSGNLQDVWQAYRQDHQMMAKYGGRYGHFNENDPDFIIAGVMKVKE